MHGRKRFIEDNFERIELTDENFTFDEEDLPRPTEDFEEFEPEFSEGEVEYLEDLDQDFGYEPEFEY